MAASTAVPKMPFTHEPTTENYRSLSQAMFTALSNKDFDSFASVIHPSGEKFSWTHADGPAETDPKNFIEHFKHLVTNVAPEFNYDSKDMAVEVLKDGKGQVTGAKVWVLGIVSGFPDGKERESVDMLEMDEKGYWVGGKDVQREIGSG